jgi:hypothetical protein
MFKQRAISCVTPRGVPPALACSRAAQITRGMKIRMV